MPFREAVEGYRGMILGAVGLERGKPTAFPGKYTPEQFGWITLWQMRNLFGFSPAPRPLDQRTAFWTRCGKMGLSEVETWRRWHQDMLPALIREGHKV